MGTKNLFSRFIEKMSGSPVQEPETAEMPEQAQGKESPAKTTSEKPGVRKKTKVNAPDPGENGETGLAAGDIPSADKKKSERGAEQEGLAKVRERISATSQDVRGMLDHVIEPEERTLKNYISISFWKEKREQYAKIKSKEKQDLNVFKLLSDGARPTIEYYILTILSCIIATTGLIQGSTATIIGAMIVAPLMTPILAFSLGVIWGDIDLIKTSMQSIIKGTVIAILISALIAYLVPIPTYSGEIIARTKPSLFDIIVAVASGIVGAYGNANKKISNTLVGIAIAVALMPPLCTIGIGLGKFNIEIATGATILFIINLVSISLAGAIVFWAMKIHPVLADEGQVKKRALYQIAMSIIILVAISIPVGIYMWDGFKIATSQETVRKVMLQDYPGLSIFQMKTERIRHGHRLILIITGKQQPGQEDIDALKNRIMRENSGIRETLIQFIQSSTL
ncbi:MAG TPA: TIGR00341 family protein [Spirochaetota bacterium]|nr:TIGR00341 family protein [Spirochaetota bacterium]